jgi:hypothetical protein
MSFKDVMETAGKTVDAAGVVIVIGGLLLTSVIALVRPSLAGASSDLACSHKHL